MRKGSTLCSHCALYSNTIGWMRSVLECIEFNWYCDIRSAFLIDFYPFKHSNCFSNYLLSNHFDSSEVTKKIHTHAHPPTSKIAFLMVRFSSFAFVCIYNSTIILKWTLRFHDTGSRQQQQQRRRRRKAKKSRQRPHKKWLNSIENSIG